jgi:serine phosphatase RsbU (regulator of sigma subunit)
MPDFRTLPATAYLLVGSLAILLGAVIFRENSRERIHRVTAFMLVLVGIKAAYEGLSLAFTMPDAKPQLTFVTIRSSGFLWEFFFPTLVLFASVFPAERPYLKRVKWSIVLLYLPHTFHFLLLLFLSFTGKDQLDLASLPSALDSIKSVLRVGIHLVNLLISVQLALFSLVNIGYVAAAVTILLGSYRASSNPRLKGQLRIITWGLGSCVGLYTLAEPVPTLLGMEFSDSARQALVVTALTLGAGSIAYSIVRYRFLDTQLLARRSILYATITTILVGVYLTLVQQVQALLAPVLDLRVIEPVFLVLALILFQPVLIRLEDLIDRLFLRDRHDHRNILRGLSRDIITILDRRELTQRIVTTLSEGVLARTPLLIDYEAGPGARVVGVDLADEEALRLEGLMDHFRALQIDEEFLHRDQLAGRLVAWGSPLLECFERLHLYYILPIRHSGATHGLLLLGRKVTGVSYTGEEISLLSTLANQVGVALQNAALYRQSLDKAVLEEELALARKIQERLLPACAPIVPGFEISAANVPSKQVGGDFYDLVDLKDGRVLFAIADVAGKGVPAALLTSMLQASLRTQIGTSTGPARILGNLNELTYQFTGPDQFATFFLGVLDGRRGTLTYANAGHNYPILIRPDGELLSLDQGGLLLGAFTGMEWPECEVRLRHGDRLVVYTDGVTEARPEDQDEEYGERRFLEHLGRWRNASASEMMESILEDVTAYAGLEQADDITLIVVNITAGHPEPGRAAAVDAVGAGAAWKEL